MIGILFGLSAGFLYAVSTIVARAKVERDKVGSAVLFTLLSNNFIFASVIIFKAVFFNYQFIVNYNAFIIFALSGFFGPFLGRTLLFASSERIGVSKASSIKILSPVFSAIIALIFLKEVIPWTGYLGVFIVVYGLYWLQKDSNDQVKETTKEGSSNIKFGTAEAYGCALFYSIAYIFRKKGITIYPYPLEAAFVEVLFAQLYYLLYFMRNKSWKDIIETKPKSILFFFYSGAAASGALFLNYYALQYIPATIGATLVSMQAFFAILLVALTKRVDEKLTYKLIIGSLLIFLGVTLTLLY